MVIAGNQGAGCPGDVVHWYVVINSTLPQRNSLWRKHQHWYFGELVIKPTLIFSVLYRLYTFPWLTMALRLPQLLGIFRNYDKTLGALPFFEYLETCKG